MPQQVTFLIEPLGAFGAVVLAEAGEIFFGFRGLVCVEMARDVQVGVDLVEVAGVAAGFLFGLGAAYGWHSEDVCGVISAMKIEVWWGTVCCCVVALDRVVSYTACLDTP